ncbi:class I SAM-dependent methyltransferase [Lactococcus chungangensis]|uniref:class I SAM-dependent methyltransferase n=1 Tax=Pseudolactococcus chungangensis TaxID=451457 RepID=UPI0037357B78
MSKNYEKLSETYYNRLAKKFDRSFDGFLSGFFKRYILKNLELPEHANVLDVGSATGCLLKMLASKYQFEGIGLDISSQMTEIAQKQYPEFSFVTGSAMQLPFEGQSFDVLICSASFHHFPNPETFLREAERVLKPGGKLVIAEIRMPIFHGLYNQYIHRFSKEGDVKVYTFDELMRLLETAGFVLIKGRKHLQIQYFEAYKKA